MVEKELRDFLEEENSICMVKNANPLDNLTIKSLIGPYYDAVQKTAEEEILEKQHPFYRGGRVVGNFNERNMQYLLIFFTSH